MSEWVTWIIQVVAYGIICFLLKRELNQMDDRHRTLSERIEQVQQEAREQIEKLQKENLSRQDGLQHHIEEVQREAAAASHEVEEKLDRFISDAPFKYTLRDDFIRTVASMENKLDKILDQLNRNSGS